MQISFNKSFYQVSIIKYIYFSKWEGCSESCSKTFYLFFISVIFAYPLQFALVKFQNICQCLFIPVLFLFFFFYLHPEWMNVLHSMWMSAEMSFLTLKQSKTFPFPRLFSFKYCDRSLLDYFFEPLKTSKNTYIQRICPQVILQSVVGSRLNLSAVRAVFLWLSQQMGDEYGNSALFLTADTT